MPNKNLTQAIIIVIICSFFASFAQLFLKTGINNLKQNTMMNFYFFILLGIIFLAISAALLLFALKKYDLSVVYPFISLSFIWVIILSNIFLEESILLFQWIGILFIIIGVFLVRGGALQNA